MDSATAPKPVRFLEVIKNRSREQRALNFTNETGLIGEKVAREWLIRDGYEVYSFRDIIFVVRDFRIREKSKAKYARSEKGQEHQRHIETFLHEIFGDRLEDIKEYDEGIKKLSNEAKVNLLRDYKGVGIGTDFVVKKDGKVLFCEVKTNKGSLTKYQRRSIEIAKVLGFETKVINVNVRVDTNIVWAESS